MYYLHSAIKLAPGKYQQFTERLRYRMVPLLAKHGWTLVGSYAAVIGRRDTAVDLWQLEDANGVQSAMMDPAFAQYGAEKAELIEDEVVTLMRELPVFPDKTKP
jgi:hypothetical protein